MPQYNIPRFGAATQDVPQFSIGGSPMGGDETPQTVNIDTPPSNFITSVQDAQNGRIGGTIQSSWVRVPGSNGEPNRYFWFSHDGTGVDPGLYTPILAAHIGHEVALGPGNQTATAVASAFAAVVNGIPGYLSIAGPGTLIIEGPIRANQCHTGTPFENRGQAEEWGLGAQLVDGAGFAEGTLTGVNASRLPAPTGGGAIKAIRVLLGNTIDVGDRFRLAIYRNSTVPTSPVGAELVWDAGQIDAADMNTDSWSTIYVPQDQFIEVSDGDNLWFTIKGNVGTTDVSVYSTGTTFPFIGEFYAESFTLSTSVMSQDPAVAYEATWAGTVGVGGPFVLGLEVIYEQAPYAANGAWDRWYGTNSDVNLFGFSSRAINSTDYMLVQAPNMEGLLALSQSIGIGNLISSPQFRLMYYSGGVAQNPNGAVLLWDGGLTAAATTFSFYDLDMTVGPGPVVIPPNGRMVLGAKNDNAAGIRMLYTTNIARINPEFAPMDFAPIGLGDDPFYRINPANPNHGENPILAAEATIQTDASDTTPAEYLAYRIRIGTPGFVVYTI